ncbi:MAG: hypothetical protein ACYC67_14640 [Prosthecobacter sp.]
MVAINHRKMNVEGLVESRILDLVCARSKTAAAMPLYDPYAFQLAGFSEGDVDEILADLDYLHRNSRWTHRRDQIERMIVESPVILLDFLRSVQPEVVRNAMIPRRVKDVVLR